jgi:hypothetical protein
MCSLSVAVHLVDANMAAAAQVDTFMLRIITYQIQRTQSR